MEVNVEDIMNEIRAEIREKGYTSDVLSFKELMSVSPSYSQAGSAVYDLQGTVIYINDSYSVAESVPVTGNVIVRFIKKIIRKLLRFYVKPIVMSQNEFNALCARALTDVSTYITESAGKSVDALEGRISALEQKLDALTKENESLKEKLSRLESK